MLTGIKKQIDVLCFCLHEHSLFVLLKLSVHSLACKQSVHVRMPGKQLSVLTLMPNLCYKAQDEYVQRVLVEFMYLVRTYETDAKIRIIINMQS